MDDQELFECFESCTIPYELWRQHITHVKVAYLMLSRYPFDEALARIRVGIKAVNDANNVPDGPLEGYNETTTHALLHLIHVTIQAYGGSHPCADADAFVRTHPQLGTKHVLRLFYSPEHRLHPDAKKRFVEPDLAPLPRMDVG